MALKFWHKFCVEGEYEAYNPTEPVDFHSLSPKLQNAIKNEAQRIQRGFDKGWPDEIEGMTIIAGHRYWLTFYQNDFDNIKVERYLYRFSKRRKRV